MGREAGSLRFLVFQAHLQYGTQNGPNGGEAKDHRQTHGSEAESNQGRVAQAEARAG
jgi:hypothetical protein